MLSNPNSNIHLKCADDWQTTFRKSAPGAAALLLLGLIQSSYGASGDLDVGGRIMVDYHRFDGLHNDDLQGDDWHIRRARINVSHDSERGWEGELEIDIDPDSGEVDIKEAAFEYKVSSSTKVFFGKMKEGFGLLNSTSSNDIYMLERSIASEIFSPGRNMGIAMEYEKGDFFNTFGIYQTHQDDENKSHHAFTLRSVYNPVDTDSLTLHLGISATQRNLGGDNYEVNDSIEVPVGSKFVESPEYSLDKLNTYAYEGAVIYKRFSFQTEYFQQSLEPMEGAAAVDYDGFHAYASWFLTNHRQQYKNGSFDGFSPHGKETGWELVAGVSEVNLVNDGAGMIVNSASLSLNYYLSETVKFVLHTAQVEVDSSEPEEVGDGNSTSLRLVYQFD